MKSRELRYIDNNLHDIKDKVVIITGSNSGIGLAAAKVLVIKKAHVVLACRSLVRAKKAKDRLLKDYPDGKIDILIYDQSSIEGTKAFVREINTHYPRFYALILNAGILGQAKEKMFENKVTNTVGVNYLANLSIIHELEPLLKDSEIERRIIFEGSIVGHKYRYKPYDIYLSDYKRFKKYNLSKHGVIKMFEYYKNNNINPNVLYLYAEPGIASTKITRSMNSIVQFLGYLFLDIFAHSNTVACLPLCYLTCNIVANGDVYLPRSCFHLKGYPKKATIKTSKSDEIVVDGFKYLGVNYDS